MASGYLVNPAAMDGSMQLGMARGLSASVEERDAGARVPAGVAAFAVQAPGSMAQRRLTAVAAFDDKGDSADSVASSFSSHRLVAGGLASPSAELRDLEARVLRRRLVAGTHGASAAEAFSAEAYFHDLEWQTAVGGVSGGNAASGPSALDSFDVATLRSKDDVEAMLMQLLKGVSGTEISADEALMETGAFDSLGVMEFRSAAESRLGVYLPVMAVAEYPTISSMAGFIFSQLASGTAASLGTASTDVVESTASFHDGLSRVADEPSLGGSNFPPVRVNAARDPAAATASSSPESVPPPPIGISASVVARSSARLRFLCLHGYRNSALKMRTYLEERGWNALLADFVDFVSVWGGGF